MLNKDFYRTKERFNILVVPSVDFIQYGNDKGYNIQENEFNLDKTMKKGLS